MQKSIFLSVISHYVNNQGKAHTLVIDLGQKLWGQTSENQQDQSNKKREIGTRTNKSSFIHNWPSDFTRSLHKKSRKVIPKSLCTLFRFCCVLSHFSWPPYYSGFEFPDGSSKRGIMNDDFYMSEWEESQSVKKQTNKKSLSWLSFESIQSWVWVKWCGGQNTNLLETVLIWRLCSYLQACSLLNWMTESWSPIWGGPAALKVSQGGLLYHRGQAKPAGGVLPWMQKGLPLISLLKIIHRIRCSADQAEVWSNEDH